MLNTQDVAFTQDWQDNTGAYVQNFIKSSFTELNTELSTAIKDIKFERNEEYPDQVDYFFTRVGKQYDENQPSDGRILLTAPSNNKVFLTKFEAPRYIAPGEDCLIKYGFLIYDSAKLVYISKIPDVKLTINGATITFRASGSSYTNQSSSRIETYTIPSRYIQYGTNTITINITYTDSNNAIAQMYEVNTENNQVERTKEVACFDFLLAISGINVSKKYNIESDTVTFNPQYTDGKNNPLSSYGIYPTLNVYNSANTVINTVQNQVGLTTATRVSPSSNIHVIYFLGSFTVGDTVVYSNVVKYQLLAGESSQTRYAYCIPNYTSYTANSISGTNKTSINIYDNFKWNVYAQCSESQTFTTTTTQTDSGELTTQNLTKTASGEFYLLGIDIKIDLDLSIEITDSSGQSAKIAITALGNKIAFAEDYELYLSSAAKQTGEDPTWKYNTYTTSFSGFDWSANGWINNQLVINNGASAIIKYRPCETNLSVNGRTVSFRIKTDNDVYNDLLVDCYTQNADGFRIYGQEAVIYRGTQFKSTQFSLKNEYKEITFVWHNDQFHNLSMIYVNGKLQSVLNGTNSTTNQAYITLQANLSTCSITNVTAYRRALNFQEVQALYYKNAGIQDYSEDAIFNSQVVLGLDNGQKVTIDNLPVGSTYMLINAYPGLDKPWEVINRLSAKINDEETKSWRIPAGATYLIKKVASGETPDPLNFYADKIAFSAQGTSSMDYPIKNFRIYFNKKVSHPDYLASGSTEQEGKFNKSASVTSVFVLGSQVSDTTFTQATMEAGAIKACKLYADSVPTDIFCLKADYAESSGVHNTGFARLANYALENSASITKVGYSDTESNQLPINMLPNATYLARSTVDGKPIYLFFRDLAGNTYYHGKYNINNEKATSEVYGFSKSKNADSAYFGLDLADEVTFLKQKFGLSNSNSDFEDTHDTFTYNGLEWTNPIECWEFSTNEAKDSAVQNVCLSNRWLKEMGAFNFPYNTESGYPFYNSNLVPANLDPFKFLTSDGKLAWINTEQAWEYRFPDFEKNDDPSDESKHHSYLGHIALTNPSINKQPLLLKTLYKWVHKHNIYCLRAAGKPESVLQEHAEIFAQLLHLYFNINYLLKYYMFTKWFICSDQRVKNCMLAFLFDQNITAADAEASELHKMRAYYIFYDNDSILGVDNDGNLTIPWNADETSNTFAGIDLNNYSAHGIWGNLEYCYNWALNDQTAPYAVKNIAELMEKAYNSLRATENGGRSLYDSFMLNTFGASASNVDADIKYFFPTTLNPGARDFDDIDKYQGTREFHREWLFNKRTLWFDARYGAKDGTIKAYSLPFKVGANTVYSTQANVKITSALPKWRFYYIAGDSATVSPSALTLQAGDEVLIQLGTAISISNIEMLSGLYAAQKLDFSGWYGNTANIDNPNYNDYTITSYRSLPYLTDLIIGNPEHKFKISPALINNWMLLMPNLTNVSLVNLETGTNAEWFDLTFTNCNRILVLDLTDTACSFSLPSYSNLLILRIGKTPFLKFNNALQLQELSISNKEDLVQLEAKHCNDYTYEQVIELFLESPTTRSLDIKFGTDNEADTVNANVINGIATIAQKVKSGEITIFNPSSSEQDINAGQIRITGKVKSSAYTGIVAGTIDEVFSNYLEISNVSQSGEVSLTATSPILKEGDTISIHSDKDVTWTYQLPSEVTINATETAKLLTLTAQTSGDNRGFNSTITITATTSDDKTASVNISIIYTPFDSFVFYKENGEVITDGTYVRDNLGIRIGINNGSTKNYLSLSNITVACDGNTLSSNDGTYAFILPNSGDSSTIRVTGYSKTNTLTIMHDRLVINYANLSTNSSPSSQYYWLYLTLNNNYISSNIPYSSQDIYRADLHKLAVNTTSGTLKIGGYTFGQEITDAQIQNYEYLQYFKFEGGTFVMPYLLSFSKFGIPADARSVSWTQVDDSKTYKEVIFSKNNRAALINLQFNGTAPAELKFNIENTDFTKIYHDDLASQTDGLFNLYIYSRLLTTTPIEIFKWNGKIKYLGGDTSSKCIFALAEPLSAYSGYNLGKVGQANDLHLGYITNYKKHCLDLSGGDVARNTVSIIGTFAGTDFNSSLSFTNVTTVGESAFLGANFGDNSVTFSDLKLLSLGVNAFNRFTGKIYIGNGDIANINIDVPDACFQNLQKNNTFQFNNVNNVGEFAFAQNDSSNVTIVVKGTKPTNIGTNAFMNCTWNFNS